MPKPKPISLAPLKFKEAVAALLKVKPQKAKKKEHLPKLMGDTTEQRQSDPQTQ